VGFEGEVAGVDVSTVDNAACPLGLGLVRDGHFSLMKTAGNTLAAQGKGGLFDLAAAGTIARCGYRGNYAEVTAVFEMLRPGP
jgi:hypothetical protein